MATPKIAVGWKENPVSWRQQQQRKNRTDLKPAMDLPRATAVARQRLDTAQRDVQGQSSAQVIAGYRRGVQAAAAGDHDGARAAILFGQRLGISHDEIIKEVAARIVEEQPEM